jgi:hypothetical protein
MTQQDTTGPAPAQPEPDHAGSTLARLLVGCAEVTRTDQAGCTQWPEGSMSYGMTVILEDGQELLVDVQALTRAAG